MNAFDPEQMVSCKRRIASHYYPLIGPYDSGDPAVIEYHLLLMKLAGIDGIMVDWYGLSDFLDYAVLHRNTTSVFKAATKIGLRVGICYEDQTIPKLVEAKRISAGERVSHARRDIQWLRRHWFAEPAYLKLNGKPVLLSFGSEGLSDEEWEQVLLPEEGSLIYLSEHRQRQAAAGSFDWPQPHLGLEGIERYYRSVKAGQIIMPVAFPRFHDIYREGSAQGGYLQIPDDNGRTFSRTLERAAKSGAPLAQIATWNDWGEGTAIEPSKEFGYRDMETIWKRQRSKNVLIAAAPEDLRLPHNLWVLRGIQALYPQLKVILDKMARQLAAGDIAGARLSLQRADKLACRQ